MNVVRAGPYYCRICDETFDEIPVDAILIRDGFYKLFRFPDDRLHDLTPLVSHKRSRPRCQEVGQAGINPQKKGGAR